MKMKILSTDDLILIFFFDRKKIVFTKEQVQEVPDYTDTQHAENHSKKSRKNLKKTNGALSPQAAHQLQDFHYKTSSVQHEIRPKNTKRGYFHLPPCPNHLSRSFLASSCAFLLPKKDNNQAF